MKFRPGDEMKEVRTSLFFSGHLKGCVTIRAGIVLFVSLLRDHILHNVSSQLLMTVSPAPWRRLTKLSCFILPKCSFARVRVRPHFKQTAMSIRNICWHENRPFCAPKLLKTELFDFQSSEEPKREVCGLGCKDLSDSWGRVQLRDASLTFDSFMLTTRIVV